MAGLPRPIAHMPSPSRLLLSLLILLPLSACSPRTPQERAFDACRAEIARRLVNPGSARYDRVRVDKRSGDGLSVVDGWDVQVAVEARAGDKKTARSTVLCTLGTKYELLDLAGEQQPEG